ncbi:hypothetical protein JW992_10065 [candidate division KSB1 bacterium]|nr:hypothetical protein [candidate division KSB1 bacterium]
MNRKSTLFSLCIGAILVMLFSSEALAIPALARRYKISCNTCHAPFPKLKPYGEEVAGNGFIIPEEEKERDYVTAGDDLLWLNRDFPISARFDAYGVYDDTEGGNSTDLQTPWGVKLLSGGALYKNIGYYFYFYMSERGEVAGIEDAYIHFDNVLNTPLDVMLGQFQTSDPLMKRELRLTFEDYQIYKTRIGLSSTNLAYDRGVMLVYGIEQTGTDIVGLLVNGNGIPDGGFDQDKYKNYGFRLSQAVNEILTVGGFYYRGKDDLGPQIDEITYYGPDFNLAFGKLEVTGQYLLRKDDIKWSHTPQSSVRTIETTGIVLEAIFAPQFDRSRWYLTALYNQVDSDYSWVNYETATLSYTYLMARNLRFIGEFTRDLEHENNRLVVGFTSGF